MTLVPGRSKHPVDKEDTEAEQANSERVEEGTSYRLQPSRHVITHVRSRSRDVQFSRPKHSVSFMDAAADVLVVKCYSIKGHCCFR